MQMEPGPPRQPLLHLGVFMGAVVINDQVDVQIVGYIPFNVLEEREEFLMAVAVLALRQHFPSSWSSMVIGWRRKGSGWQIGRGHTRV